MTRWSSIALVAVLCLAAAGGCSDRRRLEPDPGGIGDRCEDSGDCRSDLVCRDDLTCGPGGTTAEGDPCTYTGDCVAGLACLWERDAEGVPRTICRPAGATAEGGFCATTAECEAGLVCVVEGFGGRCRRAATLGDLGEACDSLEDCYAGLVCGTEGECTRATSDAGGPGFPIWDGIECAPRETEAVTRFYFEIPRGPLEAGHDFFRLPWPNDIRRTSDGHVDLSDFPHPAMPGLTVDVLDRFLRAAEEDLTGFGTNGTVFFRSSKGIDWGTINRVGEPASLYFVDLTPPPTPTDVHARLGFGWFASTGHGRYICQDWLAIRPPRGWPLMPGRSYAVVITASVKDADGATMTRDPDFVEMLRPTRPAGEEAVGRAWDAYAPFRAYLDHDGIDPGAVLVAAVFTTQDFPAALQGAKRAVDTLAAPEPTGVIECTAAAHSLCDDDLSGDEHVRGCFGEDPAFHELQGRFPTPIFQQGTPPYGRPEDGGGFEFEAVSGDAVHVRDEDICFSLTVPKDAPMPAEGWPVVVYAHGTGGSYRSFVTNGVAAQLSSVVVDAETTESFAVLSYDEPQHGRRRAGSAEDPEVLFFNFMNPRAAYGNVLQGAIDAWQAARLVASVDWSDPTASPTGSAIVFDTTRTYFYGHSQGATHGALAVAYDPSLAAAVMSGAGGSLIDSLLTKTSPYNISGAVRMALADTDIGTVHPALSIFQMYLEVADPVNYGKYDVWLPFDTLPGHSVLQIYGLDDTYSPKETQAAMAAAFGLAIVEPVIDDIGGFDTVTAPSMGNRNVGGSPVTAVLSQHNPAAGEDGHFVSTQDATAIRRVSQFFGTAALDGTPTIVP